MLTVTEAGQVIVLPPIPALEEPALEAGSEESPLALDLELPAQSLLLYHNNLPHPAAEPEQLAPEPQQPSPPPARSRFLNLCNLCPPAPEPEQPPAPPPARERRRSTRVLNPDELDSDEVSDSMDEEEGALPRYHPLPPQERTTLDCMDKLTCHIGKSCVPRSKQRFYSYIACCSLFGLTAVIITVAFLVIFLNLPKNTAKTTHF